MLKRFLRTTKGRVIAVSAAVAAVALVGVVVFMLIINSNKYRSISVADVNGTVNIIGQKNNGQAYKGQRLFDGDDVTVTEDSELTLCLNNDKYVYADENTHFKLEAASSKQGNKLKIVLDKGSELNVLTAKLGDGDTYQVDTPNSTMSVRGTRFRMTVYTGEDGYTYTLLEVESGVVFVQLKTLTGEYNGVEKEFYAGESALIRGGDDFSEFVLSDENTEVWMLDHASLPSEAVPRLVELLKKNEELELAAKEAEEKVVVEEDDKDKNQVAEKDTDKDKDADKDTDADKDADKDSKDKDAKDKDAKDSKDGKDAKDSKDNKDNKDNKDTAKDNNDANNQASGGGNNNQNNNTQQADHTHTWGDWYYKSGEAPTCEAGGKRTHKCSGCGAEESEPVGALGHNWGGWFYNQGDEPTCVADGKHTHTCSVCGKQESETVGALGHNWGDWFYNKGDEPTCVADGKRTHTCSVCGAEESEAVGALGHDWSDWNIDSDNGCKHDGSKSRHCNRCSEPDTQTIPADPNKHDWDLKDKGLPCTDPDTGKTGTYNFYICNECGESKNDDYHWD
jgi:hypothetical protein